MNPFTYGGIVIGEDFCNRVQEVSDLIGSMKSGAKLFVLADRRMGKTSLVRRAADKLPKASYLTIYVDLWATSDEQSFVETYARALAEASESTTSKLLDAAKHLFKSLQPVLTVDDEGKPAVSFLSRRGRITDRDLDDVLDAPQLVAKKKHRKVVVIFDEFQRLADYADDSVERRLRSAIQHHQNVSYIFLGSRRSIIRKMFLSKDRPLYRSAGHYPLGMIAEKHWAPFITKKFLSTGKKISPEVVHSLVQYTEGHPFYTQHLAYSLWDAVEKGKNALPKHLKDALETVLVREHYAYSNVWEALTAGQRRLLIALASQDYPALSLFSSEFINRYELRTASNVQRGIKALMEKDLVDHEGKTHIILDRFFRLWIQRIRRQPL